MVLGPKWVRLARNGTNPRLFHIRFKYILAWLNLLATTNPTRTGICQLEPKCTEIWCEKVPDLSHLGSIWPHWKNLSQLVSQIYVTCGVSSPRPDLGPNWVRMAPNGDKSGIFHIRFLYILAKIGRNLS